MSQAYLVADSSGEVRPLETLCADGFRAVDISGEGLLDLPQFQALLRRLFHELGGAYPQPDKAWYGKVFESYASKCGGRLNLKCVVDVARQYCAYHDKKTRERQMPQTASALADGSHASSKEPQMLRSRPSAPDDYARSGYTSHGPLSGSAKSGYPSKQQASPSSGLTPSPVTSPAARSSPSGLAPSPLTSPAARGSPSGGSMGRVHGSQFYEGPPRDATRSTASPTASPPTALSSPLHKESQDFGSLQLASRVMCPVNTERMAVFDHYQFDGPKLGEGSFGRVSIVVQRTTGQRKACKTIGVRNEKAQSTIEQEINLLKRLDHPNIMRLSESFLDGRNMYLICELCEGGPLLEGFTQRGLNGSGGEVAAASCMQQILSAASYCHAHDIIHRDLKPDNVLYVNSKPDSAVKVIDFGLADFFARLSATTSGVEGAEAKPMQRAGTFLFMAPEMIADERQYTEKVDVWSIGCILFLLVTGVHPFCTPRMRVDEIKRRMSSGCVLEHANWAASPPDVRDFVRKLLQVDPRNRLSAAEALQHRWFAQCFAAHGKLPTSASVVQGSESAGGVPKNVFECLKQYQAAGKLKKAVLRLLAKEVDEDRIQRMREVFAALDVHKRGFLARDELLRAMQHHPDFRDFTAPDLELILPPRAGDRISSNEFIAALLAAQQSWSRAELLNAFQRFDVRREGKISIAALSEVLKNAGSAAVLEEVVVSRTAVKKATDDVNR